MAKKILIVDDDELTKRLLSCRLTEEGYDVVSAQTGAESIKQAMHEKPDIVIMDIMLPDMQGSDAVKAFQDRANIADDMTIVFLSGIISRADKDDGKVQVGTKLYPAVAKPVDFDELLELIR